MYQWVPIVHWHYDEKKLTRTLSVLKSPWSKCRIENWNINPSWQILTQKGLTYIAWLRREQRLFLFKIIKILSARCKTQSCLSENEMEMVWALARRFVPKPWFSEMCTVNFLPYTFPRQLRMNNIAKYIFHGENFNTFFCPFNLELSEKGGAGDERQAAVLFTSLHSELGRSGIKMRGNDTLLPSHNTNSSVWIVASVCLLVSKVIWKSSK